MAYYTRYEKLQKYYKDGTPFEPAEYKKGTNLGVAEYSSLEECQNSSTPPTPPEPGNYTCCITWESYDENINFSFNNNYITTNENPWCTKEKVNELDFHKSQSEIESLDITVDETNSITSMYLAFGGMEYSRFVKLNMPKAASLSDISRMFEEPTNLTSINFINFDTSNVTIAESAFRNCSSLTSLDLSNWNTGNLIYTQNMFYRCENLETLNLKNFDMSKASSYKNMFGGCNKLKNITCKQAFKDWCITNQDAIELPTAMREGGTGTWTIVN